MIEFDPVGSAESIPHMIKNDTLIEVLDENQLSECLKHIKLNVDDSLYILNQVQSKYNVPDRFKAVQHIITDFGEGNKFDSNKFVEFIKLLGRCLHIDILESIAAIVESAFSKIGQCSTEIIQNSRQMSSTQAINQAVNKNIEELKQIPKTKENFNQIYEICQRIATEKDRDAMMFAVKEEFVYVTGGGILKANNILIQAAEDNEQDFVRLLIESGININSRSKYNTTALSNAAFKGHHEIVKLLLAVHGIDVNAEDNFQSTALIKASRNNRYEVVKLLLAVPGIEVNAKDNNNWTALMHASKEGHHEVVKLLLTAPGINVNAKDTKNNTAMSLALRNNHYETVKMLKNYVA